jgi:hypothetical protein
MADWKQITARIRRARTSKDPAGQLSNLYEKTRDAMVAFELGRHFETSGQNPDAARWYTTAAERFRRADWKGKAQEAALRLGGQMSQDAVLSEGAEALPSATVSAVLSPIPEPGLPFQQNAKIFESIVTAAEETPTETPAQEASAPGSPAGHDRRTAGSRGRPGRNRGNRGRSRRSETASEQRDRSPGAAAVPVQPTTLQDQPEPDPRDSLAESIAAEPRGTSAADRSTARGRSGDPGLSSRLSLLEMQFRRLMTCSPVRPDEADRVPLGPGVFVLTDSDMTSYYYVEACQTLRLAVTNLTRGSSQRRGGESIKLKLAEYLEIPETRVPKYLSEHCVVRWLQLDEGASHFAHFVIAVLRPTLNE